MAQLISKRYAEALFEVGLELNRLREFKEDINIVANTLEGETDLQTILKHPRISKDEKKTLLDTIFINRISQELFNFLYIIVDRRRGKYLMEISKEFEDLFNQHYNILEVTAVTAIDMDDRLRGKLTKALNNMTHKTILLKNIVDKDVMGGVFLRIENRIIDGTIKGQLQKVERILKGATL